MIESLVKSERLTYGTPDGRVLQRGLNFSLEPGKLLLITGSNGCGKSTLLRMILGELNPMSGSVGVSKEPDKVAYIPQLENTEVHMPLTLGDVLTISHSDFDLKRALSFGLLSEDQLDINWNTASGGERKRTLLTRILMREPDLLIFDEPMNHLDDLSRKIMMRVMSRFLNEEGKRRGILMVCHQGISEAEKELFDWENLDLDSSRPGGQAC